MTKVTKPLAAVVTSWNKCAIISHRLSLSSMAFLKGIVVQVRSFVGECLKFCGGILSTVTVVCFLKQFARSSFWMWRTTVIDNDTSVICKITI